MSLDRNLDHLQPCARVKVKLWLNDVLYEANHNEGLRLFLNEGLRSYSRQNELYAQGRTTNGPRVTNAKGGQSYHNFGFAVDVVPLIPGTKTPNWNFNVKDPKWRRVVELARKRGLDWGGDWLFKDFPHFQSTGAPKLADCRKKWPTGWDPEA